jgi:hypothetical protein
MRKRLAIYGVLASLLAIFTWYATPLTMVVLAVWGMTALVITLYEIRESGHPARSALAVAIFWQMSVTVYTLHWAGIVFLGYGGAQLEYLKVGLSPDWWIREVYSYT